MRFSLLKTLLILIISLIFLYGCKKENKPIQNDGIIVDSSLIPPDSARKDLTDTKRSEGSVIRKGIINVASIDLNKDGKVYQCPMDYNVIDDKPGNCPECGMALEQVTVAKAKQNLEGGGYKVK